LSRHLVMRSRSWTQVRSPDRFHQSVLRLDQLQFLDATPEQEPFDGDPERFRLGVEAARLGLAYEYDPYFSLSIYCRINSPVGIQTIV
jgi:hypothetical protein